MVYFLTSVVFVTLIQPTLGGIIPQEVAVFPGGNATFTCETPCPFQRWNMTPNYSRRDDPVKEPQYTTHISGVKSNTTVLCYCLGPYELVGEAFIYVQGLLPPVELEIVSNTSSITISWSAPFSLDVTGVDPDIWYSVLIYNVTDEDHPRVVPCTDCTNLTETHYIFSPEHYSPCHEYTFIIIPVNGVGEGSSRNATTTPWNCSIHVISSRNMSETEEQEEGNNKSFVICGVLAACVIGVICFIIVICGIRICIRKPRSKSFIEEGENTNGDSATTSVLTQSEESSKSDTDKISPEYTLPNTPIPAYAPETEEKADPDDIAPNMPIPVGPETEKEVEAAPDDIAPNMPIPVGPETEKEVEANTTPTMPLPVGPETEKEVEADPDDIAPTMPLPVGPETEEEEQEGDLGYTPPDTPIPVRGPLTEEEEDTFTTCPQESPLTDEKKDTFVSTNGTPDSQHQDVRTYTTASSVNPHGEDDTTPVPLNNECVTESDTGGEQSTRYVKQSDCKRVVKYQRRQAQEEKSLDRNGGMNSFPDGNDESYV